MYCLRMWVEPLTAIQSACIRGFKSIFLTDGPLAIITKSSDLSADISSKLNTEMGLPKYFGSHKQPSLSLRILIYGQIFSQCLKLRGRVYR